MAANECLGQAQFAAQRAYLVLEQLAQRFDEFQAHLFRQAADIMVGFDRHRRPAAETDRFDDIRIQRALRQKFRTPHGGCMFLEHVDEQPANDLALGFGVRNAAQFAQEQIRLVRVDQRHIVVVAKHGDDLFRLAQS